MRREIVRLRWFACAAVLVLLLPGYAQAYIGPGAGFALAGSFLAVFGAIFSAVVMVISWPVRRILRFLFRRRPPEKPRFKRVVVLGLDGLDFNLTQKLLAEGKLPHLASLGAQGDFKSLASTLPPISPVAWSSFQTGVNPGKHNIFDFLTPDPKTYAPKLSSVEIRSLKKSFGLGPLRFSYGKPDVRMLRKSKPFWSYLSEYGVFNSIIRVPITFPPEKLRGVQLSAMCVPDLRGTQGTFSHYTTKEPDDLERTGGEVIYVQRKGNAIAAELFGPPNPNDADGDPLKLPLTIAINSDSTATLKINGDTYSLTKGEYTDWIAVRFKVGFGSSARGVCRFLLLETEPEFSLYVTPINIDPEKPAMAIGYPKVYPIYLSKRQGSYATLGLAEDTWGLSEQVLEDEHFLRQCMDIDVERETMFFDSLEKVPHGLIVCVFDGTDRMQHMFWRYHDKEHPARPEQVPANLKNAIEDLYVRMDDLVGRTIERCNDQDTLLMVLSDHGFNTFRRCVDLNRWLEENGYLVVDDSKRGEKYLAGVDWSRTRAFALGLTGIFLNRSDKFERGIVPEGDEAEALRAEIADKLRGLVDPQNGKESIARVYQANRAYRGPYKENAPDLIVGYASGYRVSWDTAVGKTSTTVFTDNHKAWSGDHCVDPSVVPGVLFCNRKIEEEGPRLLQIGPTILKMFGVPVPDHMDGQPFEISTDWVAPKAVEPERKELKPVA
jgi:predicted AlkP superfamily phosphohydrolase/phosphomutase